MPFARKVTAPAFHLPFTVSLSVLAAANDQRSGNLPWLNENSEKWC